nr:hypothetical protein [uncultured Carboxylicivirga sp.]
MKFTTIIRTLLGLFFLIFDIIYLSYNDLIIYHLSPYGLEYLNGYIYMLIRVAMLIWISAIIKIDKEKKSFYFWMIITFIFPYITLFLYELINNTLIHKNKEAKESKFSPRWKVTHTIVGLIIFGFFLIFIGVFNILCDNEKWNILLITLGGSILLSGVSSIVLQIFSSIHFFQKELVKTFYDILSSDDKYLSTIDYHHLRKSWRVLSKYLYRKKFSEISNDLSNIICDKYFPRDHPVYYDDYKSFVTIDILEEHKGDQFVTVKETINLDIVANSSHEQVYYNFGMRIPLLSNDDSVSKVDILKFDINGENYLQKDKLEEVKVLEPDKINFNNKTEILNAISVSSTKSIDYKKRLESDKQKCMGYHFKTIEFSGSKKYEICIETESVYSLKTNLFKNYIAVRIVRGCFVKVSHPKEIYVEFNELGTVENFDDMNNSSERILIKRYEGLILPSQGFVVGFRF